ncbi:MAG TPA: alpha/beta hydrolase [Alphaproteobacteria bacterium]
MVFSLIIFVALIYAAVIFYMALFQHKMVFHPTMVDVFTNELLKNYVPFHVVTVTTTDGLNLKGLYVPPKTGKPTIVYFHGNAGTDVDRIYKTTLPVDDGYGFLLTEYRGYGGNPGTPGEEGLYNDARAWLEFMESQNIPPENRIYYGESLGTGVAVQMATEQKPKILILEAPFTSVTDVASFYYPFLPVRLLLRHRFDSLSKAAKLDMPVLVYHGTKDRTVPYRFGQILFAALPGQDNIFVTIKDGAHHDLFAQGAAPHIMEFLHKHAP